MRKDPSQKLFPVVWFRITTVASFTLKVFFHFSFVFEAKDGANGQKWETKKLLMVTSSRNSKTLVIKLLFTSFLPFSVCVEGVTCGGGLVHAWGSGACTCIRDSMWLLKNEFVCVCVCVCARV